VPVFLLFCSVLHAYLSRVTATLPDVLGRDPAHVEGVGLLALLADAVRILSLDPELVPESMFTD
jgi:hypothetical protein